MTVTFFRDSWENNDLTVSNFGGAGNENDVTVSKFFQAGNENEVTVTIFKLVGNDNDLTVTSGRNDAHLCMGTIAPELHKKLWAPQLWIKKFRCGGGGGGQGFLWTCKSSSILYLPIFPAYRKMPVKTLWSIDNLMLLLTFNNSESIGNHLQPTTDLRHFLNFATKNGTQFVLHCTQWQLYCLDLNLSSWDCETNANVQSSVANPGSGAFLPPGSGMKQWSDPDPG
jgi:hypothetical protein